VEELYKQIFMKMYNRQWVDTEKYTTRMLVQYAGSGDFNTSYEGFRQEPGVTGHSTGLLKRAWLVNLMTD
jgi:hypothetical protein